MSAACVQFTTSQVEMCTGQSMEFGHQLTLFFDGASSSRRSPHQSMGAKGSQLSTAPTDPHDSGRSKDFRDPEEGSLMSDL